MTNPPAVSGGIPVSRYARGKRPTRGGLRQEVVTGGGGDRSREQTNKQTNHACGRGGGGSSLERSPMWIETRGFEGRRIERSEEHERKELQPAQVCHRLPRATTRDHTEWPLSQRHTTATVRACVHAHRRPAYASSSRYVSRLVRRWPHTVGGSARVASRQARPGHARPLMRYRPHDRAGLASSRRRA